MPRSISGDSVTSTVFYLQDEYDALPGTCKTCCLRCACPSLLTFLLLISGVTITATFSLLAMAGIIDVIYDDTEIDPVLVPDDLYNSLISWDRNIKWIVSFEIVVMVIIAFVMLSLGFLATGSVRKEFLCRFKSKTSGRCQLAVIMIVLYLLWFVWLVQSVFLTIPVVFFFSFNQGVCKRVSEQSCVYDFGQVGMSMLHGKSEGGCYDGDKSLICDSNLLVYTGTALAGCLLVLYTVTQLLINTSANYTHLRSRYKKIYNGRNSGTYTLTRTGSIRNSRRNLAGSRSTVAAGMVGNPNFAPEKMPYSITGSERNSFRSAVVNDGYIHDHAKNRNGIGGGSGSASVVGYGTQSNHYTMNTLGHDSIALSSLQAPSTIHDMNTLGHDSIGLSSLKAQSTYSGSTAVDYGGNPGNTHRSSDHLMYRTEYAV